MDALTFEIESNPAKERKKGMKERREWNTKNFQKQKRMNFQIDARYANEKTKKIRYRNRKAKTALLPSIETHFHKSPRDNLSSFAYLIRE